MKFISLFESMTHAKLKDCFIQNEKVIFMVQEGDIAKALGKHGINIQKLEKLLNKKIKIIEFSTDILRFVKNVVHPLQVKEIHEKEGVIVIIPPDTKTRGYLIGRGAVNLRNTESIVKRYYPGIQEIKVM
jgi:N utilization substance protein A